MSDEMGDERVLSGSVFLEVLCDQALLSRARKGHPTEWIWAADWEQAGCLRRDGFWMGALVAAYVDAILDDVRNGEVVLSVAGIQHPDIQNLGHHAAAKCPLYLSRFVGWAVDHATRALCASPFLAQDAILDRQGGKFRFSRVDGVVRVNRVVS